MSGPTTTQDLYEGLKDRLRLEWIAGHNGAQRSVRGDSPGTSGQTLVGPLNCIHPNRIQVIGRSEQVYLAELNEHSLQAFLDKLFCGEPAALILADGIQADPAVADYAEREGRALLASPLPDNKLINHLQYFLTHLLAERTVIHGVFMEVLSMGVLITGDAAVGKSELALELISRGHRLIADDAPVLSRVAPDIIEGSCPEVLREFLEVRGLGVINVRAMFGDAAIKHKKYLRLVVHLSNMDEHELARMDRLSSVSASRDILGLEVPEILVPVAPGRNMAILVETAVRSHLLRLKGYDATADFIERQRLSMEAEGQG